MDCPHCGSELFSYPVPTDLQAYAPAETAHAATCRHCLHLEPVGPEDAPADLPDFTTLSDAFPEERPTAAAMALLVGLLSSLALHRTAIFALLERVERDGVDPLLVLDRLATDSTLDPETDLATRRTQLLQLLE